MSTRGIGAPASEAGFEDTSVNGFPDDEMLGCVGVKPLEARTFVPLGRGSMGGGNDGKLKLSSSSEDASKWNGVAAAKRQKL